MMSINRPEPTPVISHVTAHHEDISKLNTLVVPLLPEYHLMPNSKYLIKREELQNKEWVVKLHNYLSALDKSVSPQVNMVFGDYNHSRLVLNWITAAVNVIQPPLNNVLVLSLDNVLCGLIASRTLPVACVAVAKTTIFNINILNNNITNTWLKGVMVRNVILRVINYWGYDVASYDSDAVLLKNPQVLYDKRPHIHLFSSAGTYPSQLSREWGFALCTGTLMLKASPAIGITILGCQLVKHLDIFSAESLHSELESQCVCLCAVSCFTLHHLDWQAWDLCKINVPHSRNYC